MDQIWRYDSGENMWVKYGYYKTSRTATPAWKRYDAANNAFLELTDDDVVTAGDTILFYRGGAQTTLTLSGAVKAFVATPSYALSAHAYTFIAYPWPVAFPIADISNYYAGVGATSFGSLMDQVWRYDANENMWVKYGFYKTSRTATPAWKRYDSINNTFLDLGESDVIPAGQGFLFYRGGAETTLTFTYGN